MNLTYQKIVYLFRYHNKPFFFLKLNNIKSKKNNNNNFMNLNHKDTKNK